MVLYEANLRETIPTQVGLLTKLTLLFLKKSPGLTGRIPTELGNLTSLERLVLHDNVGLTGGIPSELGNLGALETLNLGGNIGLNGTIPAQLGSLDKLLRLDLFNHSGLSGTIPSQIGRLADLTLLHMSSNSGLTGKIPSQIWLLRNLEELYLAENPGITGSFPTEVGRLSKLKRLALKKNIGMSGTIASEIGNLTALQMLDLSLNSGLNGTIPSQIWLLKNLNELYLGQNHGLTGSIPTDVGILSKLGWLSFYENVGMTGTIPTEIGKLTALRMLDLSDCSGLNGTIPTQIGKFSVMSWLYLYNIPRLSGSIPTQIGRATNMVVLEMDENPAITGSIPTQLGQLLKLTKLQLNDMPRLSGTIPTQIGRLSVLSELLLYDDPGLTGTIPTEIGKLAGLFRLYLDQNPGLNGTIPTQIGKLSALAGFHVFSNHGLSGTIPTQIGNLTELTQLWIYTNSRLSGTFPSELGELTKLRVLRLDNNTRVTGKIPPQLGSLTGLNELWLYENPGLTGAIPSQLAELDKLTYLVVDSNRELVPSELGRLSKLQILYVCIYFGLCIYRCHLCLKLINALCSVLGELTCDCKLLSWYPEWIRSSTKLRNTVGTASCSDENTYGGLYPHLLAADPQAPCSHVLVEMNSTSSRELSISWTYPYYAEELNTSLLQVVDFQSSAYADATNAAIDEPLTNAQATNAFARCDRLIFREALPVETKVFGYELEWLQRSAEDNRSNALRTCLYAGDALRGETQSFSHTITSLDPARDYDITVRPFFLFFEKNADISYVFGPRSKILSTRTADDIPQSVPTELRVVSATSREIRLTWNKPDEAARHGEIHRYKIRIVDVETGESREQISTVEEATLRLNNLFNRIVEPRRNYSLQVAAKTAAPGFSKSSAVMYVETCSENMLRQGSNSVNDCFAESGYYATDHGEAGSCSVLATGLLKGAFDLEQCLDEGLTAADLFPSAGFWKETLKSETIRLCPRRAFCNGQNEPMLQATPKAGQAYFFNASRTRDIYCTAHHEGVYCSRCIQDYALTDNGCIYCTPEDKNQYGVFILAILVFFLILLFMYLYVIIQAKVPVLRPLTKCCTGRELRGRENRTGKRQVIQLSTLGSSPRSNGLQKPRSQRQGILHRCSNCAVSCTKLVLKPLKCCPLASMVDCANTTYMCATQYANEVHIPAKLRIFFGYLQVTAAYKRSFQKESLASSGFAASTTMFAARFGLDRFLGSFRCVFDFNHYHELLLVTLAPMALTILSFLLCKATSVCQDKQIREKISGYWVSAFLLMLFLIYPATGETIIATFICESFPDSGERALVADYRLSCSYKDPDRILAEAWAGAMFILYPVGVLVGYIKVLNHYYDDIQKTEVNDKKLARVKFLIAPYTKECCYFEAYELLRKLVLGSTGFLLNTAPQEKYPTFAALIAQNLTIVSMAVLLYFKPYQHNSDLVFAVISIVLLMAVAQFSILQHSEEPGLGGAVCCIVLSEMLNSI